MQNKSKIQQVFDLIREIESANIAYGDEQPGYYFDYDTVIELLQKASNTMVSTVRCPKPEDVPKGIPWCESMNPPDDEFNLFVNKGDMSLEDFRKAQKQYDRDMKADMVINYINERLTGIPKKAILNMIKRDKSLFTESISNLDEKEISDIRKIVISKLNQ